MSKMTKFARIMRLMAVLMSLSLDTIAQIEDLIREDKNLAKSIKEKF